MKTSCSPVIGQFSDNMIVASSDKDLGLTVYIYILLDVLLCSITEYFYELCCILASP